MNKGTTFVLLVAGFLASKQVLAQDDDPVFYKQIEPKHSYSIEFGLPVPTGNLPFRKMMQGLAKFSASYQFSLKNHFAIGIGGSYSYFPVSKYEVSPNVVGGIHFSSGYLKFAHEQFYNERFGMEFGLKVGYSNLLFHSDYLMKNTGKNQLSYATLVEPSMSLNLSSNANACVKWLVSYSFYGIGFKPERIGYPGDAGFDEAEFSKVTQFLTFGFGYTHYFREWK